MPSVNPATRRRRGAISRGWRDAMDCIAADIERLMRKGLIDEAVARELRDACLKPPPEHSEEPSGFPRDWRS